MQTTKKELTKIMGTLRGIVPKKPPLAPLQGILVKDSSFIASDTFTTIRLKSEDARGSEFIIPEKAFGVISALPDGMVEITGNESGIDIKADKIKSHYAAPSYKDFPLPAELEDEEQTEVDAPAFIRAMRSVSCAMGDITCSNSMFQSMQISAKDGLLHLAALDGHMVMWEQIEADGGSEYELLVPRDAILQIKDLDDEGKISIRYNKLSAVFSDGTMEITTRLMEGRYFNYRQMFDGMTEDDAAEIIRPTLLGAVERAAQCKDPGQPVIFDMDGQVLSVESKGSGASYHEDIMLTAGNDKNVRAGFDPKLVIKGLKAMDSGMVRFGLTGAKSPLCIYCPGRNLSGLMLPVLIR